MKNHPWNLGNTAYGRRLLPSLESDPDVSDPHPGRVSDGTHPEAN